MININNIQFNTDTYIYNLILVIFEHIRLSLYLSYINWTQI